ncbi:MAG: AAA family ATPase [Bryobacteraceae bacterium]|nr:AAA family ATPase [Bryobacteraceae bacterium]
MFGALLIASNPQRARILKEVALESGVVLVLRALESYPSGVQLTQLFNALDPDLLFLDASEPSAASVCAGVASSRSTKAGVLATAEQEHLTMLAADPLFPVLLPFPPLPDTVARAVDAAIHRHRCPVEHALLSFLPAKAGSGASTVAYNTACALAKQGRKVVLIEADLRSGVLATIAGVKVEHSIQGLLRGGGEMDTFRFHNALITPRVGPHMLLATAPAAGNTYLPGWEDYFRLLDILKPRYDYILVDLPELVNPGTREIVQRSRCVYNVATPELLSMQLATRRVAELTAWGVEKDRIRVLLNRWQRGGLSAAEVTRHLDCPVEQVFPNDYPAVNSALGKGCAVAAHTALGRKYAEFAASLTDPTGPDRAESISFAGLFRRLLPNSPAG